MTNKPACLLLLFFLGGFAACRSDGGKQGPAACQDTFRHTAFDFWVQSLDYMDAEVIATGRDSLVNTLTRNPECAPADSAFWAYMDSVIQWHVAARPESRALERASEYLMVMRGLLREPQP